MGVALVVATACAPPSAPRADIPASGEGAERTVVDAHGHSVTVPAVVRRVVTLSEIDLDAALALDLVPVGTVTGRGQTGAPHYLAERSQGVVIVGNLNAPVIDRVIELTPDVILAGGLVDEQVLDQLRHIAPTVVTYRAGDDWRQTFQRIASTLGREAEAAAFLARYSQRLDTLRVELGERVKAEVSVVRWSPQGPAYMLRDAFVRRVLADLGLKPPPAQDQPGVSHSPPLSLEALPVLDADWLFLGTLSPTGDATQALASARSLPAFQQLKAAQAGHVVLVDGSLWTSASGPLAALAILDDVERAMTAP